MPREFCNGVPHAARHLRREQGMHQKKAALKPQRVNVQADTETIKLLESAVGTLTVPRQEPAS